MGIAAISLAGGGAERQAALWAEAVAARGARVLVLSLERTPTRYRLPDGAGVLTVGMTGRKDTLRAIRHLRKLSRSCDLVVAFQPYMGVLCMLAGVRNFIVVTGQDPRFWSDTTRVPARVFRSGFARAAAATAPSAGLIECHEQLGLMPRGPWLHVPNIVDGAAAGDPSGERRGVLFVGRLVAEKEPLTALRAATRASLPITFLGDGRMREELQAEARRLSAEHLVRFEGFNAEPWRFYADHRVLVVASRYETFANVIVESLASGTPVVSVDCDFGPREILAGSRYSRLVHARVDAISGALAETCARPRTSEETDECLTIAARYSRANLEPLIVDAIRRGLA